MMNTRNVISSPSFSGYAAPRFGKAVYEPSLLLRKVGDYPGLWRTAVRHNKLIYAVCIASRIAFARRNTERIETSVRDPFGWWNWFMGSTLTQSVLASSVLAWPIWNKAFKAPTQDYQSVLLTRHNTGSGVAYHVKRFFTALLNPEKYWWLASKKQLVQRLSHMEAIMIQRGAGAAQINQMRKAFGGAMVSRVTMSVFGVLYAFMALGVLIPLLNVLLTKLMVQKHITPHAKSVTSPSIPIQSQSPAGATNTARGFYYPGPREAPVFGQVMYPPTFPMAAYAPQQQL